MKLAALALLALISSGCPATTRSGAGSGVHRQKQFPAVDLSCATEADCDTHFRYLTDDDRCCYSCTHVIGSKRWVQAVLEICKTKSAEGCPMKKCVAPPPLKCVAGKCVAGK